MRFDSLVLVDCWGEEWIKKYNALHVREFYGRILDFVESYEFDKVFFVGNSSKIHVWFKQFYPDFISVNHIDQIKNYLNDHSSVLICGAAWKACLHQGQFSFPSFTEKNINVYTSPYVLDTQMHSTERVTDEHFANDTLPWQKVFNFYHLPAGTDKNSLPKKTSVSMI
jgi:hypothetical protein